MPHSETISEARETEVTRLALMAEGDAGESVRSELTTDGENGVATIEGGERVLVLAIGPSPVEDLLPPAGRDQLCGQAEIAEDVRGAQAKVAARLENTAGFREKRRRVWQMLENAVGKHHVETGIGVGHRLAGPEEAHFIEIGVGGGFLADVCPGHPGAFASQNTHFPTQSYGVFAIAAAATAEVQNVRMRFKQRIDAQVKRHRAVNTGKAAV